MCSYQLDYMYLLCLINSLGGTHAMLKRRWYDAAFKLSAVECTKFIACCYNENVFYLATAMTQRTKFSSRQTIQALLRHLRAWSWRALHDPYSPWLLQQWTMEARGNRAQAHFEARPVNRLDGNTLQIILSLICLQCFRVVVESMTSLP